MELVKDFLVGLAVVVSFIWALYALLFGIVSLMSAGAATFAVMPLWSIILAGVPWLALVVVLIGGLGEDIRSKR